MVNSSLSDNKESSSHSSATLIKNYSEKFEELFPQYLSIGMTEEQYWDKDSQLAIAYRKAEEYKQNRINQEIWLQGLYFYEALCRVSPILHAFAKKGTKPIPYLTEPLALTERQIRDKKEEDTRKAFNKGKKMIEAFMAVHNKKFEGK